MNYEPPEHRNPKPTPTPTPTPICPLYYMGLSGGGGGGDHTAMIPLHQKEQVDDSHQEGFKILPVKITKILPVNPFYIVVGHAL